MTAMISYAQLPTHDAESPATTVLDIIAGLHQGVSLRLDRPDYMIGRASTADVVLHDPSVTDHHVRLRLQRGQVAIEAVGGDVTLDGPRCPARTLRQGHGMIVALPVELQLGEARLALQAPAHTATRNLWRGPRMALGGALLLGCGAVFALHQPPVEDFSRTLPPTAAAAKVIPTVAQARPWLAQQLEQAGLTGIHLQGDEHRLNVTGSYTPAQHAHWAAVQHAFDRRYGQYLVLHGTVTEATAPAAPRVRFQAAWFGKTPYVVDGGGRVLYPGAALDDHWVLAAVADGKVVLARGDERFTFTL